MTKKNYRNAHADYYDDDFIDDRTYHDELKERRKLKRLKNAIRSKNISDLLDYEDYE